MANYKDAEQFLQQLKQMINKCIENHPLVRSAIKAQKAIVWEAPDKVDHTVKVKFPSDLFDVNSTPSTFPYNPNIPDGDLEKGKAVFVFYYQSLSNGVVMQNATWSI